MAPSQLAQRRTHNLLLAQRLFNLRDGASPFTLILDTLEQGAQGVVREFIARANSKTNRSKVIFASFQTLKKPVGVDVFIKARSSALPSLGKEVASHVSPQTSDATQTKTLIIFDTLNPLAASQSKNLPIFLSSLLGPSTSIVAVYHTDVPLTRQSQLDEYCPDPLTTLQYLATAIIRVSSLLQTVERKRARDKSLQEPEWGLREGREGVLKSLSGTRPTSIEESVLEMEIRRKSGRGVKEVYVLSRGDSASSRPKVGSAIASRRESDGAICLLEDHPLYAATNNLNLGAAPTEEEVETTFSLGLTEKQRRDRDNVVLPYFDAQGGGGEGGRILYDMGREDDFDEEEDEI